MTAAKRPGVRCRNRSISIPTSISTSRSGSRATRPPTRSRSSTGSSRSSTTRIPRVATKPKRVAVQGHLERVRRPRRRQEEEALRRDSRRRRDAPARRRAAGLQLHVRDQRRSRCVRSRRSVRPVLRSAGASNRPAAPPVVRAGVVRVERPRLRTRCSPRRAASACSASRMTSSRSKLSRRPMAFRWLEVDRWWRTRLLRTCGSRSIERSSARSRRVRDRRR